MLYDVADGDEIDSAGEVVGIQVKFLVAKDWAAMNLADALAECVMEFDGRDEGCGHVKRNGRRAVEGIGKNGKGELRRNAA